MEITNKNIAAQFNLLAKLMELHAENKFKIRSYQNAYQTIRRYPQSLSEMSREELLEIDGIGKAIADKILAFIELGHLPQLKAYQDKTPQGVQELLTIRGLGPKKIKQLWEDLEIESPGELLYACKENRLLKLKGMGAKTQENIQAQLEFFLRNRSKVRLDQALEAYESLYRILAENFSDDRWTLTGELRRMMPEIERVEVMVEQSIFNEMAGCIAELTETEAVVHQNDKLEFMYHQIHFELISISKDEWFPNLLTTTGGSAFVIESEELENAVSEVAYFEKMDWPYIPAELRDHPELPEWLEYYAPNELVEVGDIKGLVHAHTDWSDGGATLEQMVAAAIEKGYEYLTITDHSKAAFYANGLDEIRLAKQGEKIKALNQKEKDFTIFAGCEVDILNDGSMDLDPQTLAELDIVIASVHSNLKMSREKAMNRLIKAIENPYVHMLGHPTSRLILAREGYPIDHKKIIDACAANGVAIEINANPLRLDIDWKWVPYCMEKGILISINPDAHSIFDLDFVKYGVMVARKGGLIKSACLNTYSAENFMKAIKN